MEHTTLTERLRRAEAEIAAGRPEQALTYCQELQAAYPRALRVQRVLGEIYLALRRPREALAALDRALAGDPEDVRACCARALVHQMHGDNGAALAWYRRACDIRPGDQALRATYRDLARRLGEPPYRPSRAGLARLYLRGDLFVHAIREWEQLVTENSDMLDAQVGLAETLWRAGHARAAEERCRRILVNAPSCVKAMLIQMALALDEGDMDSARGHLERTLQLDPDMTIAQMCFADAIASGDPVLIALLRPSAGGGDALGEAQRQPAAGAAQSGPIAGQRNVSRPLVTSVPNTSGPAYAPPPPPGQPMPPPARPDVPVPSQPTEVTRAFRETAFMIWGHDEETQPRLSAQRPAVPPTGPQDTGAATPPALRDLTSAMDDEETKRALNWYNWLQAQGAVALGTATALPAPLPPTPAPPPPEPPAAVAPPMPEHVEGSPSVTKPLPENTARENVPGAMPDDANGARSVPEMSPRHTMPIPHARQTMPLMRSDLSAMDIPEEEPTTVPLPLPPPDALRTMFAELGGNTAAQPVVDASAASDSAVVESSQTDDAIDATDGGSVSPESAVSAVPDLVPGPMSDDSPDETQSDFMPADDGDQPSEPGQPPQTLEDLERRFSASGFTQIETRPGLLAEIERTEQSGFTVAPQEQPPGDEPVFEPSAVPEPAASEPVASEPIRSGPDPRDYPARLAHARQRRDDGQLDDALNEYRAIIKNAPDLLPEVLSDLNASLEELPDHSNLHSVLGDALVSQGQYEQALEAYNKATELAQTRGSQD